MDLRTAKTERAIRSAFLELRAKKPLERITVKELCQRAEIHKSTFYDHYEDLYALSDALENQVLDSVLENLTHPEDLFDNPERFTRELFLAYCTQDALLHVLFSDGRGAGLVQKIQRGVKELAFARRPDLREDPVANIALSYAIYGGYYALEENRSYGLEQIVQVIASASRDVQKLLQDRRDPQKNL